MNDTEAGTGNQADTGSVGGTGEGRGVGSDAGGYSSEMDAPSGIGASDEAGTSYGGANPIGGTVNTGEAAGIGSDASELAKMEEVFGIPSADSPEVGFAIAESQGFIDAISQAQSFGNVVGALANGLSGIASGFVGEQVAGIAARAAISLGINIGLTPAGAIALGVVVGTYAGYKATGIVEDAIADAFSSDPSARGFEGIAENVGEGDIDKIREHFADMSPKEAEEELIKHLRPAVQEQNMPLYRRRSNIIGTGLTGLTIE